MPQFRDGVVPRIDINKRDGPARGNGQFQGEIPGEITGRPGIEPPRQPPEFVQEPSWCYPAAPDSGDAARSRDPLDPPGRSRSTARACGSGLTRPAAPCRRPRCRRRCPRPGPCFCWIVSRCWVARLRQLPSEVPALRTSYPACRVAQRRRQSNCGCYLSGERGFKRASHG